MCSEATDDSSIDISLGREIMHDVQKNDDPQQKLQRNKRIEVCTLTINNMKTETFHKIYLMK